MNKSTFIDACQSQADNFYNKIVDKLECADLHNQDYFKNQKLYNLYTILKEVAEQCGDEIKFSSLTEEAVKKYVTGEIKQRTKYEFSEGDNVMDLMTKYPNLSMNDLLKKVANAGYRLVGGIVTK